MADESNNAPPVPPAQVAPVTQPTAPVITPEVQALIDAARAEERTKTQNATWAEARRKYEKQSEPPKQTPSAQPSAASQTQPDDFDQQFTQRLAVESLVHGIATHGLNSAQADAIKKLYKAEGPSDVAEWVKQKVVDLGFAKQPMPATQEAPSSAAPTQAPAQTQPTSPTTPAPAPVQSSNPGALPTDVLRWSKDMRDAYLRSKAPIPHDLHDRRNRAAWRELARMGLDAMATMRVVPSQK